MNINSLADKSVILATNAPARSLERSAAPAQAATNQATSQSVAPDAPASVEVRLSPVTQSMTNNVARSGTDVFNAEKVQAMRSAIQNGSFSVNADVIADRLMANARDMLSVAAAAPRAEQPAQPSQ